MTILCGESKVKGLLTKLRNTRRENIMLTLPSSVPAQFDSTSIEVCIEFYRTIPYIPDV